MKIKAQFEFDGELPKELWWIAYGDWGDEQIDVTLEPQNGDLALVVTRVNPVTKDVTVVQLKTECTGMRVIGTIPDQDA